MNTAFLFPGQGAQKPGMLHELVDDPAVQLTLDEMSDILKSDVRLLDSPEALNSTVSVQLAFLASGVATARALQRCGAICCAVADLSVGAFAAAVVAEAVTLEDAVILVRPAQRKWNSYIQSDTDWLPSSALMSDGLQLSSIQYTPPRLRYSWEISTRRGRS